MARPRRPLSSSGAGFSSRAGCARGSKMGLRPSHAAPANRSERATAMRGGVRCWQSGAASSSLETGVAGSTHSTGVSRHSGSTAAASKGARKARAPGEIAKGRSVGPRSALPSWYAQPPSAAPNAAPLPVASSTPASALPRWSPQPMLVMVVRQPASHSAAPTPPTTRAAMRLAARTGTNVGEGASSRLNTPAIGSSPNASELKLRRQSPAPTVLRAPRCCSASGGRGVAIAVASGNAAKMKPTAFGPTAIPAGEPEKNGARSEAPPTMNETMNVERHVT